MQRKAKNTNGQYPPAYVLQTGTFREEQACGGKAAYYFFYDDGRFPTPDYKFFLETQLLASELLRGVEDVAFYIQIFVEATQSVALHEILALAGWTSPKDVLLLSYEVIDPQSSLQKFSFFVRNIDTISHGTFLSSEKAPDEILSISVDYYAVQSGGIQEKTIYHKDWEQIKKDALLLLITDDTHGVWTILLSKKYTQKLLIEHLTNFCDDHFSKLRTSF